MDTVRKYDDGALDRKARSNKAECVSRFEELILSGRFAPGDRLPSERELASELGASRPIVHAALRELELRGLVKVEPRRGVFVADWRREGSVEMLLSIMSYSGGEISPQLFDSMLEFRILFETETARLAALRAGEAQLRDIERAVARESLLEKPGPGEVAQVDYEFHLAVALASGNDTYPLLLNSMKRIYKRILDRFYTDPAVVPEVFRLHRLLASAIAEGQEHHSADLMRQILDYGERNLRRIMALPGGEVQVKPKTEGS